MSPAAFRELHERLRNRVPWGADDRRGALNHITPATILAAVGEVRLGRSVSMAAPVETVATVDNPEPSHHDMISSPAEHRGEPGLNFAYDRLAMNIHGNADTHIDALCHVVYDGLLYNRVTPGDSELTIAVAGDGIVGRGVLLDIPRVRSVPWLEPGDHVTAADLVAAERSQDVRVGPGDLLFVHVGHRHRRNRLGPWDAAAARAGLHPSALEFLADRGVAVLGSDGNNDTAPAAGEDFPVHVLAINALGVYLIDYLDLVELCALCEEQRRWSFLCVIAPLRLPEGTGSPVNPIAVL